MSIIATLEGIAKLPRKNMEGHQSKEPPKYFSLLVDDYDAKCENQKKMETIFDMSVTDCLHELGFIPDCLEKPCADLTYDGSFVTNSDDSYSEVTFDISDDVMLINAADIHELNLKYCSVKFELFPEAEDEPFNDTYRIAKRVISIFCYDTKGRMAE